MVEIIELEKKVTCARCHAELNDGVIWKDNHGRYYCSSPHLISHSIKTKEQICGHPVEIHAKN